MASLTFYYFFRLIHKAQIKSLDLTKPKHFHASRAHYANIFRLLVIIGDIVYKHRMRKFESTILKKLEQSLSWTT